MLTRRELLEADFLCRARTSTLTQFLRASGLSAVVVLFLMPGAAFAEAPTTSAPSAPPAKATVKADMVPSLIVMNARGASLQGQTLTLTGVSPNSIVFADRPVRAAGHLLTAHLLEEWSDGSFAKDSPNATVSVLSKNGDSVRDAVVVLRDPHLEGDRLTFDVRVLEGDLGGADGPASVFVDIIGLPFTPLSFAGVAWRGARRAAPTGTEQPPLPPHPIITRPTAIRRPIIPTPLPTEMSNRTAGPWQHIVRIVDKYTHEGSDARRHLQTLTSGMHGADANYFSTASSSDMR